MKPNGNIFEVNASVLCRRISAWQDEPARLVDVPPSYWRSLSDEGFDAVWLMGVWQRSAAGRKIDIADPARRNVYDVAVPGWREKDYYGSPYAVYSYTLDTRLGAADDLLTVKNTVNAVGLGLILDFVPNHLAVDNPWTREHPEYFVQGSDEDFSLNPGIFYAVPGAKKYLAHGRDPNFPPWKDTVQVNYMVPSARDAMIRQLVSIARFADGVRCDMAMLALSDVFARTWGLFSGNNASRREFWQEAIERVKREYPEFIFIAEAYWDLEWELQKMGFDYTYDKRLYERLLQGNAITVDAHLRAAQPYQAHSLRFIENHDEPRAVTAFGRDKSLAAAAVTATVPGAHLFHDGQMEGKRLRQPVQLAREPLENTDPLVEGFYRQLLDYTCSTLFVEGHFRLLNGFATWGGNESYLNFIMFLWLKEDKVRKFTAVNYAPVPSQARVRLPEELLRGDALIFSDALTGAVYRRSCSELGSSGMFIALGPWKSHLFDVSYGSNKQ